MARMLYRILFSPEARDGYDRLGARDRAAVRDAIDRHLRHQPTATSRSRIKRLAGLEKPQYRLRVGEVRVFYDVAGDRVEVLGVVEKRRVAEWLGEQGVPT